MSATIMLMMGVILGYFDYSSPWSLIVLPLTLAIDYFIFRRLFVDTGIRRKEYRDQE